ncbi:MAG: hypothetical protein SPL13_03520 [Clostridia bacterium]|nr:hypothetical protein [Clostridia bacterium]
MTNAEKIAVATAYDCYKDPGNYPIIDNKNTPEENAMGVKILSSLFEIDENGTVIGFNPRTVDKFLKIKDLKGIE